MHSLAKSLENVTQSKEAKEMQESIQDLEIPRNRINPIESHLLGNERDFSYKELRKPPSLDQGLNLKVMHFIFYKKRHAPVILNYVK